MLLLFLAPIGVDAAKTPEGLFVTVKFGAISYTLLPKREKKLPREMSERQRLRAEKKAAQKAAKKAEKAERKQYKKEHPEEFPKKKPDFDKLLSLAKMALRALNRFRLKLSFDLVRFHYTSGGDPYDAALKYGRVSALLLNLPLLAERALNVRRWELDADCDFMADRPVIEFRAIITIQLWEILSVAFAFAFEFIAFWIRSRREKRRAERKIRNAEPVG